MTLATQGELSRLCHNVMVVSIKSSYGGSSDSGSRGHKPTLKFLLNEVPTVKQGSEASFQGECSPLRLKILFSCYYKNDTPGGKGFSSTERRAVPCGGHSHALNIYMLLAHQNLVCKTCLGQ